MDPNKGLLLLFVAVLLALSVLLVLPFLQYFLLALLLVYVLAPLQDHLEERTSPRRAAAVLVVGAAVTLVLPLIIIVRAIAADAAAILRQIREGNVSYDRFEESFEELTGIAVDVPALFQSTVGGAGMNTFDELVGIFGFVTHALLGVGLSLFLLYYFLKDGDEFARWLRRSLPVHERVQSDLYERIYDIMGAVLVGHVLVALIQGVIAGLGLVAVGIPNAGFWTAVMILLSLLPIVGSFLVWGPAVAYLFVIGRPVAAGLLFVYGTIVVGVSDDYLRPIIVDRYARLNPSVIIIGVLGGVYVIGFMGIFFGPVIIGALRATLDVYRTEYHPTPEG